MKLRRISPITPLCMLALMIISIGLTMSILYQARNLAPEHNFTRATFKGLDGFPKGSTLYEEWAPRVLSIALSEKIVHPSRGLRNILTKIYNDKDDVLQGVPIWVALWFALICLVYILAFRERSLFYLFGTYACISFGYMPGIVTGILPWDMPAVFFFVLFVALLVSRPTKRFMPVILTLLIWTAMFFKETAVVLSIFPLFLCQSWKISKRLSLTLVTATGAMTIKILLNLACNGSFESTTAHSFFHNGSLLAWNFYVLRSLSNILPFLINAGTFIAFLILPPGKGIPFMLKLSALLFIIGQFIFGIVTEYRIWFEMIPIALYCLDVNLLNGW